MAGAPGDMIGDAGNMAAQFNVILVLLLNFTSLIYSLLYIPFIAHSLLLGMEGGKKEMVLSNVQEMWEQNFRRIGEDNPEHTVTGIIIFYPTYLIAYCEVSKKCYRHRPA